MCITVNLDVHWLLGYCYFELLLTYFHLAKGRFKVKKVTSPFKSPLMFLSFFLAWNGAYYEMFVGSYSKH